MSLACPLCGSPVVLAFTLPDRSVYRCRGCGLHFASPQPTDEQLTEYYTRFYYGEADPFYENSPENVVSQLVCRIEQRTGAMAGKRVLDFGCGIGTMSRLLLATGAQRVDAIETDPGARAAVQRELGIQVAPNIDELRRQTPPPTYDLVTMIEVVEHVRSPVETLSAIRSLVKPGGALIVETPDAESLKARLARSNWENYRNPTHLFYFTLASLQRALHLAGFARSYVWRPIIEYPAHSAPRRLVQFSLQRLGLDGALRVVAYA